MSFIFNGSSIPLNVQLSGLPNVGGALIGLFQPMIFGRVTKSTIGYQVDETAENTSFRGVMQPLTDRALLLKPEGQRAWSWYMLHAEPHLKLDVDEVVTYNGRQLRVMALKDYAEYGYVEYHLVQDWTGSGPLVTP